MAEHHAPDPSVPLFSFADVSVGPPERRRLDHVDGTIPEGGVTVVVGPSGSGKSSLLRCCNRLDVVDAGIVRFRGIPVAELDPLFHRRRVGTVFQAPVAFPGTVLANLQVAATDLGVDDGAELLARVGLDAEFLRREAGRLSGGEAQRMVLARALATGPEVLLMDEPTSALDGAATRILEALARDLASRQMPVVWVTHDLSQMRRLADHLVVIIGGRWAWSGPPEALGEAPAAVAAFLEGAT